MYSFCNESSFMGSLLSVAGSMNATRTRTEVRKSHSRPGCALPRPDRAAVSGLGEADVDPGPPRVRLEDGVGDDLGVQAVEEAGDGLATFDDRRDELPDEVVAEDGGRLALARVARAP